ncbi:MAG: Ig-like domain-containing protein, partial [Bifidobacteriaceae bacterium]|nr:Ig-like domain-containing protein [Bifidobacteriaceae bacterium]
MERLSTLETMQAGGPLPHSVRVTLLDEFDNPIPEATVQFALSGLSVAQMDLEDGLGVTDVYGQVVANIASVSTGTATLSAALPDFATTVEPSSLSLRWGSLSAPHPDLSSYSVTTGTRPVGNSLNAHQITLTIKDISGVPKDGMENEITITAGDATVGPIEALGNGIYRAAITATRPGVKPIIAVAGSLQLEPATGSPDSVTFVSGEVDLSKSSITVPDDAKVADGLQSHQISVQLRDWLGNPVDGAANQLSLRVEPSAGNLTSSFTATGLPGRYASPLSATRSGNYLIHVYVQDIHEVLPGPNNVTARFIPGKPDGAHSSLLAVTTGEKLAVSQQHTVRAVVRDVNDNPVPGALVTFTVGEDLELPGNGEVLTDSLGQATLSFTSPNAHDYYVSATISSPDGPLSPADSGLLFRFVTGQVDVAHSQIKVSTRANQVADGMTGFQRVWVYLADANGVPIAGMADQLQPTFDPTVEGGPIFDLSTGRAFEADTGSELGWYSGVVHSQKAGSFRLSMQVGSTLLVPRPGMNDKALFISGPGDPQKSTLSIDHNHLRVGETATVTATVLDANNNPATNQVVQLWLEPNGPLGGATFLRKLTDAQGLATFPVSSSQVGSSTVRAGLLLDVAGSPTEVSNSGELQISWYVPELDPGSSFFVTPADPLLANGQDSAKVRIFLMDKQGEPMAGQAANLQVKATPAPGSANRPAGTVWDLVTPTQPTAVFGEPGWYEIAMTATYAADFTISVTMGEADIAAQNQDTVSFLAGPVDLNRSSFTVATASAPADQQSAVNVTTNLVDQFGNGVPGQSVQVAAALNDAKLSKATSSAQPGVYITALTTELAASYVISVFHLPGGELAPQPVKPNGNTVAVFTAGLPCASNSSLTITPIREGATSPLPVGLAEDDGYQLLVQLRDCAAEPNAVADAQVVFQTTPQAQPDWLVTTGTTGQAVTALRTTKAATYTVKAITGGGTLTLTGEAGFTPGPVSASTSDFTVSDHEGVLADGQDNQTVTARLRDRYGNGVAVPLTELTVQAPPAAKSGDWTMPSIGVYEVALVATVAGQHPVTVTGPIGQAHPALAPRPDGHSTADFVADQADSGQSSLTLDRTSQVAGEKITAKVTARDAHGNLSPGQVVRVWLDPAATPPLGDQVGYLTAQTGSSGDALGVATVQFTSRQAGSYQVHAVIDALDQAVAGSDATVQFTAGPVSQAALLKTSSADIMAAGGPLPHTAEVLLLDRWDNPVPGVAVTFSATGLVGLTLDPATGLVTSGTDGKASVAVSSAAVG